VVLIALPVGQCFIVRIAGKIDRHRGAACGLTAKHSIGLANWVRSCQLWILCVIFDRINQEAYGKALFGHCSWSAVWVTDDHVAQRTVRHTYIISTVFGLEFNLENLEESGRSINQA
jgi:hypothetical protein